MQERGLIHEINTGSPESRVPWMPKGLSYPAHLIAPVMAPMRLNKEDDPAEIYQYLLGERIQELIDQSGDPRTWAMELYQTLGRAGLNPGWDEDHETAGDQMIADNELIPNHLRTMLLDLNALPRKLSPSNEARGVMSEQTAENWILAIEGADVGLL